MNKGVYLYYYYCDEDYKSFNLNYYENNSKKTLKKIRLIEEPKSEDLLRQEFEEALGGWNCGTYSDGIFTDICEGGYVDSLCQDGKSDSYCGIYTCNLWN